MSKKDILDKNKLFEILDDFKDLDVKAITYSGGGEPLLYPYITEVLKKTKDNGIDLSIITNGQLLKDDKLTELIDAKWVRISMDYHNEKEFYKSRHVSEKIYFLKKCGLVKKHINSLIILTHQIYVIINVQMIIKIYLLKVLSMDMVITLYKK